MGSQVQPPPGPRSSEPRGHLTPWPSCSLLLTAWGRLGRQGPASAADEGQRVSLGSPQVAGKGEKAGGRTQGRPPGSPVPAAADTRNDPGFRQAQGPPCMNTRAWSGGDPGNLQLGQHLHSGPDVHNLERPRWLGGAGWVAEALVPCVLGASLVRGPRGSPSSRGTTVHACVRACSSGLAQVRPVWTL